MTGKRIICSVCSRPTSTCLCKLVTPLHNQVELLILQHPTEARNAKNTAKLLSLSTQNSQLWIGESFSIEELQHRLYANAKQPLLLYPDTPEEKSLGLLTPAPLPEFKQFLPEQLRLVVIDATWRKSRKMLYINQALQQLPRFALINPPTTIYKIRKADSENQLSTLEASCYALQQLEPGCDYQPLLQAFRQFIDQFASYLPSSSLNQSHIEEL
jgi:DTW domain-containing protein YfiP